jgi:putative GTP pyrophosphokinase
MGPRKLDLAIAAYRERHPALVAATAEFGESIRAIIDEAGINYLTVESRAKSVASFATKARRLRDRRPDADPLAEITDQVGVRVITYVQSDILAVAELLGEQFTILEDKDLGQLTASEGRFGYSSRHLLVSKDEGEHAAYDAERCASVQLRTVLQHAWAEFEHDIRYKGTIPPEQVPDLDRRFTLAAGLLELADREFTTIRDRLQQGFEASTLAPDESDPRISAPELATFLAGRYASAGWSRTEHYEWMGGLLLELGLASIAELGEALRDIDSAGVTAAMGYRYPPGAVRRLDDDLLARFGDAYAALPGNADRRDALRTRLGKLGRSEG